MTARRGFTLIEVMIALVIGSVVVTLAYATLNAGMDVQRRVAEAREADVTTTAFRAMLIDALRHAVPADARDANGLRADADAAGRARSLSFISRGISAPHGGAGLWNVGLTTDSSGVVLNATSLDSSRTPLRLVARGVRSIVVRFLAADDANWRTAWQDVTRLPAAVELRFLDRDGRETMSALVARTAPVGGL
jgi:prepilin-type N-terminal cleavage/methylation domain-containing protein